MGRRRKHRSSGRRVVERFVADDGPVGVVESAASRTPGRVNGLARLSRDIDHLLADLGRAMVACAHEPEDPARSQTALRHGVERLLHLLATRAEIRSGTPVEERIGPCPLEALLGTPAAPSADEDLHGALEEMRAELATIRGQIEDLQRRLDRSGSPGEPLPLAEARRTADPRKQGALMEVFRRNLALRASATS